LERAADCRRTALALQQLESCQPTSNPTGNLDLSSGTGH
jgi:hypothetical protein